MENILDNSENYLRIFTPEDIVIDRTLPKHKALGKTGKQAKSDGYDSDGNESDGYDLRIDGTPANRLTFVSSNSSEPRLVESKEKKTRKWLRFFGIGKKEKKETFEIDVLDFFSSVKLSCEESIASYRDRTQQYVKALEKAKSMNQVALADEIAGKIEQTKYESILLAEGYGKKITEQQAVEFVRKTDKGVRLTYIKNYARMIPDEICEKKRKVDELLVFDNYAVMHYDSGIPSFRMTKEEEERERARKSDPILFGLIKGTKCLYYIGDWTDDDCDLTLEELMDKGEFSEEDITIKDNPLI